MKMVYKNVHLKYMVFKNVHLKYMVCECPSEVHGL